MWVIFCKTFSKKFNYFKKTPLNLYSYLHLRLKQDGKEWIHTDDANYSLLIYIIFSIIFVIILFYLFLDIFKNVRRKPKNKYWEKPKYN